MRHAILLLGTIVGLLYFGILAVDGIVPHPEPPTIHAISHPSFLHLDEHVALFAGISFPIGRYEIGTSICALSECRRVSWHTLNGPQEYWGGIGTVSLSSVDISHLPTSPLLAELVFSIFDKSTLRHTLVGEWRATIPIVPLGQPENFRDILSRDTLASNSSNTLESR